MAEAGRPAGENKINDVTLIKLLRENKTRQQCADVFGVTAGAIKAAEKRIKKKLEYVPPPTNPEDGHSIDAIAQLSQINTMIIDELQRCTKLVLREEEKVKIADNLCEQLEANPNDPELMKQVSKFLATESKGILAVQNNIISISGEIRKQIELQLKIAETLYNIQMMQEFQGEIIALLREVDPFVAQKFIAKMKERKNIRGLIKMEPI